MVLKTKRLTNRSRDNVLARLRLQSQRLTGRQNVALVIRKIHTALVEDSNVDHRLVEVAFRLVNFCRVNPHNSLTREVLAVINNICNPENPSEIKRYIAGRYLTLCSKNADDSDYRLPVRQRDKNKAVEIFDRLKEKQRFNLQILDSAEDLLSKVAGREMRYPDYFVRDLLIVISAARSTKNLAENGNLDALGRSTWAALEYLALDQDAIPDTLEYVGLTDDMYVISSCARALLPKVEEVDGVAEQIFQTYPFLHSLRFHETGRHGYVLSDYLALTCLPIFDLLSESVTQVAHISMVEQPTKHAIFASLIAAFCILSKEVEKSDSDLMEDDISSAADIQTGETISLDDGTKWVFIGTERDETYNQEFAVFKEPRFEIKESKGDSPLTRKMPLKKFLSAAKADSKGRFRRRKDGSFDLNAVEVLFDHDRFDYHRYKSKRRIFLVCNKVKYEELLKHLSVSGVPWKQALPISTISTTNLKVESWSGGFEAESALLYLVPNLRTLISYYFSSDLINFQSLVIVDGSTELEAVESLIELQEMDIPVCVFAGSVSRKRVINNLCERGFSSFKWDQGLVKHFLPALVSLKNDPGVGSWEALIKKDMQASVESVRVDSEAAQNIYQSFRELDQYGNQSFNELDRHVLECLTQIKNLTLGLLKLNLNCNGDREMLSTDLNEISEHKKSIATDHLLEPKQRDMFLKHLRTLETGVEKALEEKALIYRQVADSGLYRALVAHPSDAGNYCDFGSLSRMENRESCLIGYWPGPKRLYGLLNRGLVAQIHFVLFQHEESWFQGFLRNYYGTPTPSSVYPNLQFVSELAEDIHDQDLDGQQNEIAHLQSLKRSLLSRTFDDDHFADATSVFYLEPDAIVFATARSQFSVLTGGADNLKLVSKQGIDVKEGDQLVYLPHTERDAIRDTADVLFLEEGARETATQWQKDLFNYYENSDKSLDDIHEILKKNGVSRHIETIKHWLFDDTRISPIHPDEDIPLIYKAIDKRITEKSLRSMLTTIETVKKAHSQAADYLARQLRAQLSRTADAVADTESYRIFEVIAIDECSERVPYRVLSQPQQMDQLNG